MSDPTNTTTITVLDGEVTQVCMPYSNGQYSLGIWYGGNPFDYVFPVFMLQIIVPFFTSRAIYFLLRPFRQPKFVCNVLSGIILGPSVLGRNKTLKNALFSPKEMIVFNTLATLGAFYFVFITSVKTDLGMISKASKSAWTISLSCIFVNFALNILVFSFLHDHLHGLEGGRGFFFIVAACLSGTFFPVLAWGIDEINLLTSELGQLAMSCALIGDLMRFFLTPLAVSVAHKSSKYLLPPILATCSFIFLIVIIVRPAVRWIIRRTPEGRPVQQVYVITIMVGALLMGFLSEVLNGHFTPGIMAIGLTIPSGPPLGSTIVEKSELMIIEFFLPLFYVYVGYHVNVSMISDITDFSALHLLVVVGFFGKMITTFLVSLMFSIRVRNAILLGLIFNMRGLVELILFNRWRTTKFITEACYATLVVSNTAIAGVVSPLVEIYYRPQARLDMPGPFRNHTRSLQSAQKVEEFRILSGIHFEDDIQSIISLFEASNPSEESPLCVYMIHLVELVGRAVPLLIPYKEHKRKNMPISSHRIMRACANYATNSVGPVLIQFFTLIAPYSTMHENICRLAQDKFIHLIIIPFHQNHSGDRKLGQVRHFNSRVQQNASCTVGIIVDRGIHCRLGFANFSCNVALIFLGGVDDREALALVTRMSTHRNVSINLFRIEFKEYKKAENQNDRTVDEIMLREFKAMNINNSCIEVKEIEADDGLQVVDAVRSIGNNYDLLIVGKRRGGTNIRFEEDMVDWVEFPELGVIGDILASPDFHGGMMPVLVLQHYGHDNDDDLKSIKFSQCDSRRTSTVFSECDSRQPSTKYSDCDSKVSFNTRT